MLPRPPFTAKQKKIYLVTVATGVPCFSAIDLLLGAGVNDLTLLAVAGMTVWCVGMAVIGWPAGHGLPVRARDRPGSGPSGPGLAGDTGGAPVTAGRWLVMRAVARLMPPAAGRRWLAEAQSLLFEAAAGQRGKMVRSYLLSAPRLLVTMWAGELSRRTRLRPRRPG